jgi:hypothetical protein
MRFQVASKGTLGGLAQEVFELGKINFDTTFGKLESH